MLLGKILDDRGKYVDPSPGQKNVLQICNERGVAYARLMLKLANKNTIQANIDVETLQNILIRLADNIAEKVGKNYHEFGISPENRDTYVDSLLVQIYLMLTRPLGDLEREHTISQGQEHTTLMQRMSDFAGNAQYPREPTRLL